jgi:hypothetical protein
MINSLVAGFDYLATTNPLLIVIRDKSLPIANYR